MMMWPTVFVWVRPWSIDINNIMMEEMEMIITEFVNGFKSANDKEKFVKKHITRTYVPYEEKVSRCQRIIDNSMYVNEESGRRFRPNTPLRYELFIITMVQCYTDIEYDIGKTLEGFNAMAECGADGCIMDAVKSDVGIFQSVLDMMVDDTIDAERNYVDYIRNKFEAISDIVGPLVENIINEMSEQQTSTE